MKITIQKIADMCNVSRGTVDRVLHNRPNVHPRIRQTVQNAIIKTGYHKSFENQPEPTKYKIGLIVPMWPERYLFIQSNRGIRHITAKINANNFELVQRRLKSRSADEHLLAIQELVKQNVDGILLNAPMDPEIIAYVNKISLEGIKIINYIDDLPQCYDSYYCGQDTIRAGRIAAGLMAKYTLSPNDRVLACSGDPLFHSHKTRVTSFSHHLSTITGYQDMVDIIFCNEVFEITAQTIHKCLLLDDRIRYIYMATQSIKGCIEGIKRANLPYKITIICNEATPDARKLLFSGDIDFAISYQPSQALYSAIDLMYKLLTSEIPPQSKYIFSEATIFTKQMLYYVAKDK